MDQPLISIESEVFNTRLLVFLEDRPQSNEYRQIFLNAEEFKKMSSSIGKVVGKEPNGNDTVEFRYSDEIYSLPDLRPLH